MFWVLPLVFIALNLFMIPKYADTLYTGRVLQGYFVISIALLFLMLFFNAIFLLMAISINRNVRLQQENQLLSMQQQRYESLKAAIEEARQARHDLRHQLCQLAALAEEGNLEKIKAYLSGAVSKIPSLEMHFCENRAADSVVGHYCALAKRENIPYSVQIDLPECIPVDEINLCLVLSNLLENALEASLRTAPARRRIELTAYLHGNSLALIQVENTYDGVIREKDGVFQSSKRKGDGVGLQSVRHIAEKSGGVSTVTYQDGLFCVRSCSAGNYALPFQNGTATDFSSLASDNPWMYRIAVFAKTLDFIVSQSASFTISVVPFSKSKRISPHSPSLSTRYS